MKKTLFLIFLPLFFVSSMCVAQTKTKWSDFVSKVPEFSLPQEFNVVVNTKDCIKINDIDAETYFKAKANLDLRCYAIGKLTTAKGVGIIYARETGLGRYVSYLIALFDKKGKYKDTIIILNHDSDVLIGGKAKVKISMEGDKYLFEEIVIDYDGNIKSQKLIKTLSPSNW